MANQTDIAAALNRVLQQQQQGAPETAEPTAVPGLAPSTDVLTGAAPAPSPFSDALDRVLRGGTQATPAAPAAPGVPAAPAVPRMPDSLGARAAREAASAVSAANNMLNDGVRPDVAAEIRRLSRDEGVPIPQAAQTYVERIRSARGRQYGRLLIENPGLRRIATQGSAYADFMDDAAALATTETAFNALRSFGAAFPRAGADLLNLPVTAGDIVERQTDRLILDPLVEADLPVISALADYLRADLPEGVVSTREFIFGRPSKVLSDVSEYVGPPPDERNVVTDAAGALGQLGATALAYVIGGGPLALLLGGAQTTEEQRRRVEEAGQLGTLQGDIGIIGAAGVSTLIERLNLGLIFERIPENMRNRLVRALATATTEGATEALQAMSSNLVAKAVYDPDTGVVDDVAYEGLLGGFAGLVLGALTPGRVRPSDVTDRLPQEAVDVLSADTLQSAADQAVAAQQALETTRAAIEETATFARDPEAVRELLEAAGDQEVSIPVQEIERLYQEGALTDDDIAYLQVEDELTQQGDLSGDVSTTASRVLTLQGDAFARLSEHVRTQPGAPTTAEAREALANREADIERLQGVLEQAQAAADEVGVLSERIAAEVRAAAPQYTAAQGRAMGRLLAERYAARAALFDGVTATQLYERDRVTFEGPQAAPPAALPVAPTMEQVSTPIVETVQPGIDGTYRVTDGRLRAELNVAPREPYASSVQVPQGMQRRGIATALYDAAERDLGRRMFPSPLGLTEDAQQFWIDRLSRIPQDEALALLDEAQASGDARNVGRNTAERLAPIRESVLRRSPDDAGLIMYQDARPTSAAGEVTGVPMATRLSEAFRMAQERRYRTGRELKVDLQAASRAAQADAGIDLTTLDDENIDRLADFVVEDALEALRDNANAIGWYDRTITAALEEVAQLHPEILTDPARRLQFTWALAVTSNGLKVDKNFEVALQAYEGLLASDDQRFPAKVGIGTAAGQIDLGLAMYGRMLERFDGDHEALANFMNAQVPVRDLERDFGVSISGEGKGELVRGASILGPKIGNGFFANLYGNFDALTMDRWLMRTVGRWRGTLININEEMITQKRGDIRDLIAGLSQTERRALSQMLPSGTALKARMTQAELDALAVAVAKESAVPKWRTQINAMPGGEALRKLGNALAKYLDGQVEAPAGARERAFLREVFRRGLDRLQQSPEVRQISNQELTMSDLQALLWYPEKRLYDTAKQTEGESRGYADDEAPDYANAARAVVRNRLGQTGRAGRAGGRPADDGRGLGAQFEQPAVDVGRAGGYASGGLAPLEGAPNVVGASGPDPNLVAVAEQYAARNGIDLRRQSEFVEVDPERAARIAQAYEEMPHAPQDPAVKEAYQNLIAQTVAQYEALAAAGYEFYFFDETNDPYDGNPWNAMRDLRANQRMGVFATEAGFGSGATDLNVEDNPMLADTGIEWPFGAPDGPPKRVLANDLFRAVHDAFGHGIEGAGFRARGEENAWQAHVRLFTGSAVAAITSETRGQNSWLNYGPYGEQNRTAAVEDTVFADQKTGLMPEWTWTEGRAGDASAQEQADGRQVPDSAGVRRSSGGRFPIAGRDADVVAVFGQETDRPVYEVSDPALFKELITDAKSALGPVGAQVFVYDDYAGKRLFLFDDGASGFALSGDDIVSVFSIPGRGPRGAAARVLEVAVAEGGRRLDAFDTFLPAIYAKSGFKAVAAVPFSREYAPEGWDYGYFSDAFPQTGGEPGVVYMVYDPANANPATSNIVADPDEAVAAQDAALSPPSLEQPVEGPQTETKGAVGAPRGAYRLPTSSDPRNLITLSAQADPSTFVHEVGHMFLFELMRDLKDQRLTAEGRAQIEAQIAATKAWFTSNSAQAFNDLQSLAKSARKRANADKGNAQEQTRAARLNAAVERANAGGGAAYMQRVAQSFMDPQGAGYDEAAEVVYHELWARGFEQYLGTGSAPSAELRGVFAKFAKYITSIYKSLRRLNVTVSPEISDVFDRLLATEDAINAERRGALYQVSPGVLEGATPAEANELRRLAAEAEDEARTQMAARVENSLRAEERAKRRARREEIANEISLQVAAEPTYAAINIAKRGVMPDGKELGTGKISRAEFLAVSDENSLARMPKGMVSGKVAPDNAIPLGDLATLAGFPDIDTMIEALTNPTPPSEADAVKSRTDAQMAQEFGADLDAGALQTKAVEVAQNDKFQQLQQLQLRILRRLATQPMQRLAQRQAEQQGAPAAAADTAAAEAARAEQAAARTPREGVQAALARIRADVQRTANAGQRRAQAAAGRTTRGIQRNVDPAAVEAAAERFVANLKVKDATPARYRQAASRLTTKIERAIAARNYTEASSLMEQRALNLAVAKRAAVVQSKIEQQRTRWREVTARSDKRLAQRYSIDWVNAIRVMLEPFGMARSTPRNYDANKALAALASVEPTLLAEIKLTLATYGGRAQAARQAIPNAPYKDLGVQEALDMLETADTMLANARDSYGILVEGRRVEFAAISDEIAVNVGQRRKVQKQARAEARGRGTRAFRETRRQIGAFSASLRRIELWARDIDNGNPRGPMTRYLVRPVMRAVDAYTEARRGPQEALASLLRGRTDLMARKPIKATELDGYVFQSKGELLMALLHTGNPSNKRKLLLGGAEDVASGRKYVWGSLDADGNLDTTRWDRFTDRLFADGTLTKADMDLVQGIWDIFEQTKKPAQAAHKQMYGYYFTEIEAEPLITPVGTYRGGYAPAVTDVMMNPDGERFEAEEVMSQQSNAAMFPGAEKGFTQSRTEYNQPLDLDLTRIPAHFDRVMKFAYLGPAVRQAARLVTNRNFRDAVRPASPDVIDVAVIPWLQRTVQQRVTTPPTSRGWSGVSRVAAAIDRRVGLHIMAGNIVNAAQQVTGFSVAAARIPARHLAAAGTRWRVDNQSARAYILSRSTFMQERLTGGMNEASTTLESILSEPGLLNKAQNAAMRYGYFAQQLAQNLVDPTVWLAAERHGMETVYPAAYAEALERTGDEAAADAAARAEVAEYADSVVRDTQAPLRPSDVSGIEASSPLARLFLKFYSYFNAMGNLLVTEKNVAMNSEMGWAGRYGRSFYAYLMIVTVPTIVAEGIAQLARGGFDDLDDEDERDQLMFELLIGSQLKTMAAMVPFAGAAASTAYGIAVTDQIYDDRISLSAGIGVTESTLQNVIRLIGAAADPDTDVETRRAIRTTLDALGLATGLPTGWAAKPISYAASVAEGDSDPEGLLDIVQGALTGRDGTE